MRLFLLLSLFLLFSCGKKANVPDGVLPVPKMTDVLWDLTRADELVAMQYTLDTGTIRFDTSKILYRQIAKKHNTTQQQFKQSLQFYKTRPDLLQVIIDSLTARTVLPPPAVDSTTIDTIPIPLKDTIPIQ